MYIKVFGSYESRSKMTAVALKIGALLLGPEGV